MKKRTTSLVVDAKTPDQIAKLGDWCRNNLKQEEWGHEVVTMFPLWIKFRFYCPKQHVLAILSS